jgi:hypothetical protein
MKPRTYKVLTDAIEDGIQYGWNRAHKHTDQPDRETIFVEMRNAIMLSIDENFSFEDDIPRLD